MKQILRTLLICLLVLILLTACEETPVSTSSTTQLTVPTTATPTEPTHLCSGDEWERDPENHWKNCTVCGKQFVFGQHKTKEDKCTVCNVTITVQDDQSVLLSMQPVHQMYPFYPLWERGYDADGRLYFERDYNYDNETKQYIIEVNYYNADGSREYAICDHYGYPTEHILYDAQGNVTDTYTYTYKYWDEFTPSRITCSRNGVLLYEESYSLSNDQPYLRRRTDYRADGSYSEAKYNEKGKLESHECFNADNTPMNHSSRYDREAGRPLVGSWAVMVQSDTHTMGLYDLESRPINVLVTYTFDLSGNLLITQDIDPEEHYQYRYDVEMMMLMDWTLEDYPTLEEKEAACQEKFGKSPHDYVTDRLSGFLFERESHREQKGIYFVENDLLYIADSWITFETDMAFVANSDTLTLVTDLSPVPLSLKRISPDLSEYSGCFDPEVCAPLFGTWTGTVKVDGSILGIEDTQLFIMADIAVTFDDMGNMTMVMKLDPEEYRNFSIQLVIESIKKEYSHMDMDRLDRYYKGLYGLSVAEYAAAQVDAQNPAANAVKEWIGIYFIQDGLLYTVDCNTGEADGGPYSLEDDTLTMLSDEESGISIVLTRENTTPADPVTD